MSGKTMIKYVNENYLIWYIFGCPISAGYCAMNEESKIWFLL